MNIENRLRKLEDTINTKESRFCDCFYRQITNLIDSVYSENPTKEFSTPDLKKGQCKSCGKKIDEIGINKIVENIEKIYGV